jgi:hypothetical protein
MRAVKVGPWRAVISQCALYKKQHPEQMSQPYMVVLEQEAVAAVTAVAEPEVAVVAVEEMAEQIPSLSLRVPEARVAEEPVQEQVLPNPKALAAYAAVMELLRSGEKCDCDYCCGHGGYAKFGGLSECSRIRYPYHGWPNCPRFDDRPFAQRGPLYKKIQSVAMEAWDKCME